MRWRVLSFTVLVVSIGLLAVGYVIAPAPAAKAISAVGSERPHGSRVPKEVARPAPSVTPAPTMVSGRSPVPLVVAHHAPYLAEDPRQLADTTGGASVAPQENNELSNAAAKAMIEADGYKNVKGLARTPDGAWRALATRGVTEVAVMVDARGSVSAQ